MRIDPHQSSISSSAFSFAPRVASRRIRGRAAALLALAAALVPLAAASPALAFCRSTVTAAGEGPCSPKGAPLFWASEYVGYRVSTAGLAEHGYDVAKVKAAIDQGFAAWGAVSCQNPSGAPSIHVTDLGTTTSAAVGYAPGGPNENLIVLNFEDAAPGKEDTLGGPIMHFNEATGEILDVDIVINAKSAKIAVDGTSDGAAYDLATIMAHEAGHFIGLGHSETEGATMFEVYSADQRDLSADDMAGICAAYPPDGTRVTAAGVVEGTKCGPGGPVCPQEFVAGCSASSVPAGTGAGFSVFAALGLAWACRRARRMAVKPR
jgi:Matrixin